MLPFQKRTERRNYPKEVNEVSQVDEGKIAVKRGQRFLFSLSFFRGKWLRSRSILLEDVEHSNAEMKWEMRGRAPRLMVLSGSTWQCGNISSVFSILGWQFHRPWLYTLTFSCDLQDSNNPSGFSSLEKNLRASPVWSHISAGFIRKCNRMLPFCTLDCWLSCKAKHWTLSRWFGLFSATISHPFNVTLNRKEMFVFMYMLTFWMQPCEPAF